MNDELQSWKTECSSENSGLFIYRTFHVEIYWLKEIQSMWETSDHCLASLPCYMSVKREPVNFLWDVFICHIYSDTSFITLVLLNSMLSQLIWCQSKRRWNICVLSVFGLLVILWWLSRGKTIHSLLFKTHALHFIAFHICICIQNYWENTLQIYECTVYAFLW